MDSLATRSTWATAVIQWPAGRPVLTCLTAAVGCSRGPGPPPPPRRPLNGQPLGGEVHAGGAAIHAQPGRWPPLPLLHRNHTAIHWGSGCLNQRCRGGQRLSVQTAAGGGGGSSGGRQQQQHSLCTAAWPAGPAERPARTDAAMRRPAGLLVAWGPLLDKQLEGEVLVVRHEGHGGPV